MTKPKPTAPEPSDETIRSIPEAWERTGSMTELDGSISRHVCDCIRHQISAVSSEPLGIARK